MFISEHARKLYYVMYKINLLEVIDQSKITLLSVKDHILFLGIVFIR